MGAVERYTTNDWAAHYQNRSAFPFEELRKYEGQHVAWSMDGKAILAGHSDPEQLIALLDKAGHERGSYVLSFVDFETHLGGALLFQDVEETE